MDEQEGEFTGKCGTRRFWAAGASGKANPLELEPNPRGNIWLDDQGVARYASKNAPVPEGETIYISHFANCAYAKDYRKRHPL